MHRATKSVATMLFCCNATVALGLSLIDAENLLFYPPSDFKIGFQTTHDNRSITEWVPGGQTVEDWTQMLTVQIYRGATVDAATFLQGVGKRYMDACPGTSAKGIYTGQTNGYVVSMLLLKCPKSPGTGKPETTAFRVIKGKDALYSVQRAWRAIPSDEEVNDVMQAVAKVTVCDTRAPEHPCPSQVGASPGQVIHVPLELQPWQVRRAAYQELAQRLRQGDSSAGKEYDAVLTEFDTRVFARTPIENLEILGDFYIPKEGVDPALVVVVQNLVLGWYDALRFASESGRAEIVNNEGFFKRAFTRAGPDVTNRAVKFLESNPDRVHALIAQGFSIAEKYRETNNYDRHWPTAYGLERVICAQGGTCTQSTELPKEQWDRAWEEAKHRVGAYFEPVRPK